MSKVVCSIPYKRRWDESRTLKDHGLGHQGLSITKGIWVRGDNECDEEVSTVTVDQVGKAEQRLYPSMMRQSTDTEPRRHPNDR